MDDMPEPPGGATADVNRTIIGGVDELGDVITCTKLKSISWPILRRPMLALPRLTSSTWLSRRREKEAGGGRRRMPAIHKLSADLVKTIAWTVFSSNDDFLTWHT